MSKICVWCNPITDENIDANEPLESHGMCPDCVDKQAKELEKLKLLIEAKELNV